VLGRAAQVRRNGGKKAPASSVYITDAPKSARHEGAKLMESSNPVLSKAFGSQSKRGYAAFETSTPVAASSEQLDALYQAPAASSSRTGRMTMDDVVTRTGILFTVLVVSWRCDVDLQTRWWRNSAGSNWRIYS
jgi:hypothetical protein